jgi:hypothetical protein
MRNVVRVAPWALSLSLLGAAVQAQDAGVAQAPVVRPGPVDPNAQLPPGHPPTGMMPAPTGELPPGHPPTGTAPAPTGELPPGHPPTGTAPTGQAPTDPQGGAAAEPEVQRAEMPQTTAEEMEGIPPGTVLVRVVDSQGRPQVDALVRLGAMREGDRETPREMRTDGEGIARFENLDRGPNIAYRASTDWEGARYGAMPFQLPQTRGYRVQLVRLDVDHVGRAVLLWDARVEMRFKDDRLVVVHRQRVANLSGLSLGSSRPEPRAYVPTEGLRFGLPAGYTAFTAEQTMSDLRIAAEGDNAVVRGSFPPTLDEPQEITYQYHLRVEGGDMEFVTTLPLPMVNATIASEAPRGLSLSVEGFPAAELRESRGERILVTGLQRRPAEAPMRALRIRLTGIPAAAGHARLVATLGGVALVGAAFATGLSRRRKARGGRPRAELEAERDRILAEMGELARLHAEGEVGPQTYARRKGELTVWLAAVLRELGGGAAEPEAATA